MALVLGHTVIFAIDRHGEDIEGFEILGVDPCRLFHGDLRAERHLRCLDVVYVILTDN